MKKKDTNRDKLSSAEIKKFKAMLWEKRNEILGNVTTMEFEALRRDRSDLSNMPTHMADTGTNNNEIDNILGLMDSEMKILVEIDDALGRIENGTYGICEINGEPIPKARLEAIPWARYCIKCAGLVEKAWHWEWCSTSAHITGSDPTGLLDMNLWRKYFNGVSWKTFLEQALLDESTPQRIRKATYRGQPFASIEVIKKLEKEIGRPILPRKKGRKRGTKKLVN